MNEGLKVVVVGMNLMDLKCGIDKVVIVVVEELKVLFVFCVDIKVIV